MWVTCFRIYINHGDDNTTAHCEGYHASVTGVMRVTGSEALRVNKLIWFLLNLLNKKYVAMELNSVRPPPSSR